MSEVEEKYAQLPERLREVVDVFARHLASERHRSTHTVRAYTKDTVSLLAHSVDLGYADMGDWDIGVLRSWLAAARESGAARASIARYAATARVFCTWAHKSGMTARDLGQLLASPVTHRKLPSVLRSDQ